VIKVDNPYLTDEPVAKSDDSGSRRHLPVRAIVWTALLAAVIVATIVLAVQLHEQNNRIRRLQKDSGAYNSIVIFLLHHDCPVTCASNYNAPISP
jgi:hypothetical protein